MKKTIFGLFVVIGLLQADYIRDDSKGVVVDTSTNLMWQDEPYTDSEATAYSNNTEDGKVLYWENAISYCENLTYGGYDDWRLPNFNELYMLADRSRSNPAISPVFQNVVSSFYWSSTSMPGQYSWGVYFGSNGSSSWNGEQHSGCVRCVRAGQ